MRIFDREVPIRLQQHNNYVGRFRHDGTYYFSLPNLRKVFIVRTPVEWPKSRWIQYIIAAQADYYV